MLLKRYQKELLEKRVDKSLFQAYEKRICAGEPFEYVINFCEFLGLNLYIDQNVLIPRVESEILAEKVIKCVYSDSKSMHVLDLCCGSGALGLSIQKHTGFTTTLLDICPKALNVAKKNAHSNNLVPSFIQSDLFNQIKNQKFDVIVCNPPYISKKDYTKLEGSVVDFEPKLALVGGCSGLEFYVRIASEVEPFLNPGAKLFLK